MGIADLSVRHRRVHTDYDTVQRRPFRQSIVLDNLSRPDGTQRLRLIRSEPDMSIAVGIGFEIMEPVVFQFDRKQLVVSVIDLLNNGIAWRHRATKEMVNGVRLAARVPAKP